MLEDDEKKAEALLRERRLAAKGLLDKPEYKESDPIAEAKRAEKDAVSAAALRRLG